MRSLITFALALGSLLGGAALCLAADGMLGVELVERGGKVVIFKVLTNTSAAQIGIEPGDVLVKVGTKTITTIQEALDAKAAANNNEDIPFIFETPGGTWAINARFEKGQPYGKYSAPNARPKR